MSEVSSEVSCVVEVSGGVADELSDGVSSGGLSAHEESSASVVGHGYPSHQLVTQRDAKCGRRAGNDRRPGRDSIFLVTVRECTPPSV